MLPDGRYTPLPISAAVPYVTDLPRLLDSSSSEEKNIPMTRTLDGFDVWSNEPYDMEMEREIADLAYRYWERRGRPVGSPDIDWDSAAHDVNRERTRHQLGLG